jgi:polyhydroxyalkanoate synthesis regulator phasin
MSDAPNEGESEKEGLGILSSLKDALEDVISDAREKGGPSAERALRSVQAAVSRARDAAGEARGRIDFASEDQLGELRDVVSDLKARLERLEQAVFGDPPESS